MEQRVKIDGMHYEAQKFHEDDKKSKYLKSATINFVACFKKGFRDEFSEESICMLEVIKETKKNMLDVSGTSLSWHKRHILS